MTSLPKIANRVKQALASAPGTGVLLLGTAVSGFQTFADGGFLNGDILSYVLEDGTAWEIGTGTYNASGPSIARTVIQSSNNGQPLNASASAVVYSTLLAQNAGFSGSVTGTVAVSNLPATQAVSGTVAVSALPAISGTVTLANPFDGVLKLAGQAVSSANRFPVDVQFPSTQVVTWSSDAALGLLQGGSPVSSYNPLPMRILISGGEVSNSTPLPVTLSGGSGGLSVQPADMNGLPIRAADLNGLKVSAGAPFPIMGQNGIGVATPNNPLPVLSTATTTAQSIATITISGGATPTTLTSAICKSLDVVNDTSVDLEYRRNGSGAYMALPRNSAREIDGITDASQIAIRRKDLSTSALTISYEVRA